MANVRQIALETLLKVEQEGAYSQLTLNAAIENHDLNRQDTGLLTNIVYGVLQQKRLLEFYLEPYIKQKKMKRWVRLLLLMSVYQKVFLDKVPEHAIVNEAVRLAKRKGHQKTSGFVNGVLRGFLRHHLNDTNSIPSERERLAVQVSHPQWLFNRWSSIYGHEQTTRICEANNSAPATTARVNSLHTDRQSLINQLSNEGVTATASEWHSDAIIIENGTAVQTSAYKQGHFSIQDESSMLVAHALAPQSGQQVLDACAGPGGKTAHIGELMNNQGDILALDVHEHKTALILGQAKRLGLTSVHTQVLDASLMNEHQPDKQFDRILVDAPCTGLGVIRRKPEIKWQKQEKDVRAIAAIQADILAGVVDCLKPGGRLVYSTCTIEPQENQQVVDKLLQDHNTLSLDETLLERMPDKVRENAEWQHSGMMQILPQDLDTDGFFIASLIKG
ncbi:16S rRNA (cytosine(967)-C(5))-methyltransferase RsmB [Tuberibacillus sp. Marseille-P3662]|uniref:16S rRNA (cytosine(967)-C(5))-methyltransferase RsmB n=1 Tax=Tuberibacillus sp. Marseille-P3662 TaxID=1965358 RepID=UPI000A1CE4D2|nr:16S rRNA (cytosine(967)-C(5))-methyltransferase RsmB [Tuberibacillus sp. Marseille-P3662]